MTNLTSAATAIPCNRRRSARRRPAHERRTLRRTRGRARVRRVPHKSRAGRTRAPGPRTTSRTPRSSPRRSVLRAPGGAIRRGTAPDCRSRRSGRPRRARRSRRRFPRVGKYAAATPAAGQASRVPPRGRRRRTETAICGHSHKFSARGVSPANGHTNRTTNVAATMTAAAGHEMTPPQQPIGV